ncbi:MULTISPECIES: antibiotic biosynthesis monooxygenase [Streptomyces]|uniref:Antibiotic biosynthesis monooxygenase n=1 Tax=Streptomyces dengpaensis TaxID=2049881 RepID=A0ABM6SP77_9ACTN|nr:MULTISPECIES: antibiotic biosynthesis monooxygenase [Streptomyces]AVH56096.1 antibiotic biosynthesis monooxygenase [Streptomyces dengpaensis]PIB06354.1 hypothetical protein B1C81_25075 [Streptomyces sp. HG99]
MTPLSGSTGAPDQEVTVMVTRCVDPGHEEAFEEWARGILGAASRFPGSLGTGLLRPEQPGGPWNILLRFEDPASYRAWNESAERADWFARAGRHHAEDTRRELHGMEGWFATTPAGSGRQPPSRWKMAVAGTLSIAPLSLAATLWLSPHLAMAPALRSLVTAPLLSFLMTYLALPVVTRVLRRWLYTRPPARPAPHTRR